MILLAHGAAIVDPSTPQYMLDHTGCHGVQLGSSIERMAIERPIEERAAAFKAAAACRARPDGRCRCVPFRRTDGRRRRGGYAVGYFESWNLESLLAVADAAEARALAGDPRLQRHLSAASGTAGAAIRSRPTRRWRLPSAAI